MSKAYQFQYRDLLGNNVTMDAQPGQDVRQRFEEFLKVTSAFVLPTPQPVKKETLTLSPESSVDKARKDETEGEESNYCGAV